MRIAYFDCFSGICGNMVLGALIDLGLEKEVLIQELKKLKIKGYLLNIQKTIKQNIVGTKVLVKVKDTHTERKLKEILKIIEDSELKKEVKILCKKIFLKLADAEAKVHNKKPEEIHFHELGALDTLIDIVGSIAGLKHLKIKKIFSSPLNLGSGFVECSHGKLPVPAPATLELLKNIPVYNSNIKSELVTPTGAAIISTLAEEFGSLPLMKIEKVGYGAGERNLPVPNFLRVIIGELQENSLEEDSISLLETNIDDLNPQIYEHLFECLFSAGAKEVFLVPVIMKKSRPGVLLKVIFKSELLEKILKIIFSETTTFGVRIQQIKRLKLKKEIKEINTKFGKIKVKKGRWGKEILTISPEYEDCKKIARSKKVPLKKFFEEINGNLYI